MLTNDQIDHLGVFMQLLNWNANKLENNSIEVQEFFL